MSLKTLRILFADDEPVIRESYLALFESYGFTDIQAASDGEQALAILKENPVDCVVSDNQMPRMNGMELLKAMRSGAAPKTPFILISGSLTSDIKAEIDGLGAATWLAKPVGNKALLETVLRMAGS